jgi:hypothetical protein
VRKVVYVLEDNRAVFRKEPHEAFTGQALVLGGHALQVLLRLARLHAGQNVEEQAVGAQQQRLPLGGKVA